jgi:tRNA(adenine34) deaminase
VMNLLAHASLNHRCQITSGVFENECGAILQDFFRRKRTGQPKIDIDDLG